MSFWSRLFGRAQPVSIAEAAKGPVVLEGVVEVLDPDELVGDPLSGDLCVFAHYEAYVAGHAQRMMIGGGGGALNLVAKSAQATDFLLRDATGLALVRPSPGADLLALHREMLSRHGFDLQAETQLLRGGDRVRVRGQVSKMMEGSPMRREAYTLLVTADALEPIVD